MQTWPPLVSVKVSVALDPRVVGDQTTVSEQLFSGVIVAPTQFCVVAKANAIVETRGALPTLLILWSLMQGEFDMDHGAPLEDALDQALDGGSEGPKPVITSGRRVRSSHRAHELMRPILRSRSSCVQWSFA